MSTERACLTPDEAMILAHLKFHFGAALTGKFEIAGRDPETGAINRKFSGIFDVSELEAAASHAAEINRREGVSVYFTPALAHENTPDRGRLGDANIIHTEHIWVDLDEPGAAQAAALNSKVAPTYTVITGKIPHLRQQMFYRLDEPLADHNIIRNANRMLAASLRGDKSVTNPARLMRLGGTIAWPYKPDRVPEMTEFRPHSSMPYSLAVLEAAFGGGRGQADAIGQETWTAELLPFTPRTANSLGLNIGLVPVGQRHDYMLKTAMACFIQLTGEAGALPTEDELYDLAWPQFANHVVQVEAHDPPKMRDMIRGTIEKFERGELPGLPTLEAVVAAYEGKKAQDMRQRTAGANVDALEAVAAAIAPADTFKLIRLSDVKEAASPPDFVEGLLTIGGMSVLYGDSNTGKTFWAIYLALHVALGWEWEGRQVDKGGVIYCALEGRYGIENRMLAFRHSHLGMDNAAFAVIASSINLLDPKVDLPRLVATINQAADALGVPVSLVVIDTLARAMSGGNENSSEDMGALVVNCDAIRQATGAHVMFIHHTGKDSARGARGHSSLRAATDTEIEVSRAEGSAFGNVRVTKQRDLEGGAEFGFRLETVVVGTSERGKDITSCVVVSTSSKTVDVRRRGLTDQQQVALQALEDTMAEHAERLAPTTGMPALMCVRLSRWKALCIDRHIADTDKPDSHQKAFVRARKALVKRQIIKVHADFVWFLDMPRTEAGQNPDNNAGYG